MSKPLTREQLGTIEAILIGFNDLQLPRLLNLKKRVDQGDVLNEFDLTFLQETLEEAKSCEHFADTHEEYQQLVAEVADLFDHITRTALANQANARS